MYWRVVWGEPLLSRASLRLGATTYPLSLLYWYLMPTLCPPAEHRCSSGILRHYCVQDTFFLSFLNPKPSRGLLTDCCVICLSRRIHWILREPQVESFVSREICECSLCHLLACRELVQHWIGVGFAEKGVFYSAEDYDEHTGWLPQRCLGSEMPRLDWCNVWRKKKSQKMLFFSAPWDDQCFYH